MPNVKVGENTIIENAIIAENTVLGDNCYIGYHRRSEEEKQEACESNITVVGENLAIPSGFKLNQGSMIDEDNFRAYQAVV